MSEPPRLDPLGPVYIGAREIYDAVVRVQTAVDRLADASNAMATDIKDHEIRIRKLEDRRFPLPMVSIILAVAAMSIGLIQFIIGGNT